MERGEIKHRKYAEQIRDFSGLQFGKITPTDIDSYIEYRNQCHIFAEAKHKDKELPFGQKLALTRLVDDLTKPSILFIVEHETDGDIDFATTVVREYYRKGEWKEPTIEELILREAIDIYLEAISNGNN